MHSEISNEGYKNGKREGLWESYYRNGQLHTKGHYRKGKREGKWEFYYRNGQLAVSYTHLTLPTKRIV